MGHQFGKPDLTAYGVKQCAAEHQQGRCLMDGGGTNAGGHVCEYIRHSLGNAQNWGRDILWGLGVLNQ